MEITKELNENLRTEDGEATEPEEIEVTKEEVTQEGFKEWLQLEHPNGLKLMLGSRSLSLNELCGFSVWLIENFFNQIPNGKKKPDYV